MSEKDTPNSDLFDPVASGSVNTVQEVVEKKQGTYAPRPCPETKQGSTINPSPFGSMK